VYVRNVAYVADDVYLTPPRYDATLLIEQFFRDRCVEGLDVGVPVGLVQKAAHALSLTGVERRITRQHELGATAAHKIR
jgi:hypothetical protein